MKRRAFLGFLGGAAAAGPMAAKAAAEMTVADLSLGRSGISGSIASGLAPAGSSVQAMSQLDWARTRLKEIAGVTKIERAMRKAQFYNDNLDANIASLRSVSLVNKMRVSRDIQFERSEERQKSYLEGVVAGLWS